MLTSKPRFPVRQILLHGWLPSALKTRLYRLKGYRIGRAVSLGFGSVIVGRDVVVEDHVQLGFFSLITGKTIRLGRYVQVGAGTIIDTPHVEIGEGTKINEQVFVGGLQSPDSKLVVGRNCQIMQMTFINPARSIVIGDDTGIGGDCLIFGHTSWLSWLEGYPVEFEPVEIGSSVSIAWRVFVLAGTRIEDGAVIGANSLVRGHVPPRCLAMGFPARVVSREPEFPRPVSVEEKTRMVAGMLAELMRFLEAEGFETRHNGAEYSVSGWTGRGWRRRRVNARLTAMTGPLTADSDAPDTGDVFLSLAPIPGGRRTALDRRGTMWLDLDAKERSEVGNPLGEEVVQHLRRYGIRFVRSR